MPRPSGCLWRTPAARSPRGPSRSSQVRSALKPLADRVGAQHCRAMLGELPRSDRNDGPSDQGDHREAERDSCPVEQRSLESFWKCVGHGHPQTGERTDASRCRHDPPECPMQGRAVASQARQELQSAREAEDRTAEDMQSNRHRADHRTRIWRYDRRTAEKFGNPQQSEYGRDKGVKGDQGKESPVATADEVHSSIFQESGSDCVRRACARR